MYNKGDHVVKIPEGICQIENVGHADGRIRHIITKDDAMKFIKSIPDISEKDISNRQKKCFFLFFFLSNLYNGLFGQSDLNPS